MPEPTVLITGGANGIGAALVRDFAGRGSRVTVADLDVESGQRLAEETGSRFVRTDVSVFEDNVAVVAACGQLDVVCLNAGIPSGTSFGPDFDPAAYRRVLGVDLDAAVYGIQAALPALRPGGAIVVTASLAGIGTSADVFYAAAKHALIGLVRSAAGQLAKQGITINAICPGFVDTRLVTAWHATLTEAGVAIAEPTEVVEAVHSIIAAGGTGQAWTIQAGIPTAPVEFPEIQLSMRL
ncbi:MAG TPA: SDR family NAD(P)-dependent oxidoreductase [Pseudonocardiaceae bacterium]|jgi:NAD(P)-dependent dehydrogenase (short-subunit alcohol dehydrogenase family)|nr:SDR family NAD(P)-dependent oxidoreductase [Pseudonocardiaceae bacterium]